MKVNTVGMLVELEKIPYAVGAILNCEFYFPDRVVLNEKIRSIRHYDRYHRKMPKKKKKLNADEPEPIPKKLCEFHFIKILDSTRTAIQKHILKQQSLVYNEKKK